MKSTLDIVIPVHNEAEVIERVVTELYREIGKTLDVRFIISEDGSTDNTKDILKKLSLRIPMTLLINERRIKYSKALIRGLREVQSPFVFCIDSDGQYNAKDFWKLWEARQDADVVIGFRKHRADSLERLVMSRIFYYCFYSLLPKNIHDPSCSFILMRSEVPKKMMSKLGLTNEGFWWEFMARVRQFGFKASEHGISHKARVGGGTKVYTILHIPRIALSHVVAMIKIAFTKPSRSIV